MKLGLLLEQYDVINKDEELNSIDFLQGINNNKYFQECQSNKNDINLRKYRICRQGMFAYNKATSRNGEKISIAYRDGSDCLVSPSYICFSIKDENVLNHEYLMLWFRRPTFDRYVRFHSWGSATEFFDWDDMCDVDIDLPSIEEQMEIVRKNNSLSKKKSLLIQENDFLEKIVDRIYKKYTKNAPLERIGRIAEFEKGQRLNQEDMIDGDVEVVSAGLKPAGYHNEWNVKGPSVTVSCSGVNAGFVSFHFNNIWAADCTFNNSSKYLHYVYEAIKFSKDAIATIKDGYSGQQHVYARDLHEIEIPFIGFDEMINFESKVQPLFDKIRVNLKEIELLEQAFFRL